MKEQLLELVYQPRVQDWERYGSCILSQFQVMLEFSENGNLPTVDECETMIRTSNFHWEKGIHLIFRFMSENDLEDGNDAVASLECICDALYHSMKTGVDNLFEMWQKNHILAGTPCNQNFSKTNTVIAIFDPLMTRTVLDPTMSQIHLLMMTLTLNKISQAMRRQAVQEEKRMMSWTTRNQYLNTFTSFLEKGVPLISYFIFITPNQENRLLDYQDAFIST
eukprot:scaffold75443_cov72-Attheya_sp.AAC.4